MPDPRVPLLNFSSSHEFQCHHIISRGDWCVRKRREWNGNMSPERYELAWNGHFVEKDSILFQLPDVTDLQRHTMEKAINNLSNPFKLELIGHLKDTVEPPVATTSRTRPPLLGTGFLNYKKFPSQIIIFGTSCKRPPLVSDRDHF